MRRLALNTGCAVDVTDDADVAQTTPSSHGWRYKSNTGLHGVCIVQLVLRDNGLRRWPPLDRPRLKAEVAACNVAVATLAIQKRAAEPSETPSDPMWAWPSAQQTDTLLTRPAA